MRIDWAKVPKEIDGHPTRWVAMDESGAWFAYTVLPEADDSVPGYSRWMLKSSADHHWFAKLGYDAYAGWEDGPRCMDNLRWSDGTPWDETLTAVSRGGTMTKDDLRPGMVVRLRDGTTDVVRDSDEGPWVPVFAMNDEDGLGYLTDDLRDERAARRDVVAVYDKPCWERDDKRDEALRKIAELEAKVAELRAMMEAETP